MLCTEAPKGYVQPNLKHGPYSPSRLIVAKCAQRFFGQYIRKDKSIVTTTASARGSAIHHILSKITENIIAGVATPPQKLAALVSEAVGMFPAAYAEIDMLKGAASAYLSNPSPYINKSTSCETAFAVAYYEEDSFLDNVMPAKKYMAVPYANENGYPNPAAFFGGRLDQVTVDEVIKTVTILDHKSTPSANKNEDHEFQMGAYAWLVSLFYPGYRIKTVLHYANPNLNFYAAPVFWNNEELAEFENYIHSRIWAIENYQEYPAMPGAQCDYCHMAQECTMNQALREQRARGDIDLSVRSFADLPKLASALKSVGALYDEINKALKQGVEAHAPTGRVDIDGGWYGFKASDEAVEWVSTDLKIREESNRAKQLLVSPELLTLEEKAKCERMAALPDLDAVLKKWDINPDHFKKWQAEKFKHLWKLEKPGLLELLKEYIVKDKSTRFGYHKA